MANKWKDDGPDAWKLDLGGGRVARINREGDKYVARLTGGDPGGGACGSYPTLANAQKRFEPEWTPASDAVLMRIPDDARVPGPPVDVGNVFDERLAAQHVT